MGVGIALVRRRRATTSMRFERRTLALGVVALVSSGAVAVLELGRVWRRGSAPLPTEAERLIEAVATAARETSEVTVASYQEASGREAALLNLLGSFVITFGFARVATWTIHRRGRLGPFRNLVLGRRHIHHFVPGMVLALVSGAASIISRDESLDPWLAVPFGTGLGLVLDESALLLQFDDVYWTEEGVLSVQITLTTIALLATGALAARVLRRGEAKVLAAPG
jgi:hypothetical protein